MCCPHSRLLSTRHVGVGIQGNGEAQGQPAAMHAMERSTGHGREQPSAKPTLRTRLSTALSPAHPRRQVRILLLRLTKGGLLRLLRRRHSRRRLGARRRRLLLCRRQLRLRRCILAGKLLLKLLSLHLCPPHCLCRCRLHGCKGGVSLGKLPLELGLHLRTPGGVRG